MNPSLLRARAVSLGTCAVLASCTGPALRQVASTVEVGTGIGEWDADGSSRSVDGSTSAVWISVHPLAAMEPPREIRLDPATIALLTAARACPVEAVIQPADSRCSDLDFGIAARRESCGSGDSSLLGSEKPLPAPESASTAGALWTHPGFISAASALLLALAGYLVRKPIGRAWEKRPKRKAKPPQDTPPCR